MQENARTERNEKEEQIISRIRNHFGKPQAITYLIALCIGALVHVSPLVAADRLFAALEKRLIDDGVNANFVHAIYRNSVVKLETGIMAGNITRSERALNYEQFLAGSVVTKAKDYMNEHRRTLDKAYQQYGVPSSIIVSILTVETRLGTYPGKYLTINVLSTMAVANDPQVQKQIFSSLSPKNTEEGSEEDAAKRLQARAARGYRELKTYLEYVQTSGKDPFRLRGSSEGAIGIPQFLPSNISHYGRDGDGDGIIDLFDHEDAIVSVAAFLHAHHWKNAKTEKEKKRVLLKYNRSVYYANTVYSLATRLDRPKPKAK